jgi:hypothetical protein
VNNDLICAWSVSDSVFALVMAGFGRTKGKEERCLWTRGRTGHKNGLIRSNDMSPSANSDDLFFAYMPSLEIINCYVQCSIYFLEA